ncbi:MAG: hypothetical protein IPF52_17030 [Saprospiraceae bacterium]|nr:hypothetical protein [Saprospiraceae bacterium]
MVRGKDYNFKDSIVFRPYYIPALLRNLENYFDWNIYKVHVPDLRINPELGYKICHCRDTLWAKKQLLKEVERRYPYYIVDTIERYKVYDISFLDTSYFGPPNYNDPMHIGFSVSGDGKEITIFNREYIDVVSRTLYTSYENKGTRVHLGKITPEYLRYQRYDIKFPFYLDGAENITIDDYSQYLKDSMGIVVTLANEYTIPIKLIRLKK